MDTLPSPILSAPLASGVRPFSVRLGSLGLFAYWSWENRQQKSLWLDDRNRAGA